MVAMIYKGAVGYWHLDEDGGTNGYADSSGNGNTGAPNGAVVNVSGLIDGAVQLDGIKNVTFSNSSGALIGNGSLTIEMWVKVNSTANNHQLLSNRDPSSREGAIQFGTLKNGGLQFCFVDSTTTYRCIDSLVGNFTTANAWHHLAATHTFGDGASTRLYIDGVNVSSLSSWSSGGTGSEGAKPLNYPFRLGYSGNA